MTLKQRNNKIITLHKKGTTLKDISLSVGISPERVRQIIQEKDFEYCEVHKTLFKTICKYCNTKNNYIKKVESIAKHHLMDEIKRLSKPDRRKEIVLQRQALIRLLHDKYKFTFSEIGDVFERDTTSIVHIYKRNIKI